jgi:phage N-6-adenine-methyltransferase
MTAAIGATAPPQKPGKSVQDYQTPRVFLDAVVCRFGEIGFDLAAAPHNTVVPGKFFDVDEDALEHVWPVYDTWLWLNPPYARLAPWAAKCVEAMKLGSRILLLTPASTGSNWFQEYLVPNGHVIDLGPRIIFPPETQPYPKDMTLTVFMAGITGRSYWRWNESWGIK